LPDGAVRRGTAGPPAAWRGRVLRRLRCRGEVPVPRRGVRRPAHVGADRAPLRSGGAGPGVPPGAAPGSHAGAHHPEPGHPAGPAAVPARPVTAAGRPVARVPAAAHPPLHRPPADPPADPQRLRRLRGAFELRGARLSPGPADPAPVAGPDLPAPRRLADRRGGGARPTPPPPSPPVTGWGGPAAPSFPASRPCPEAAPTA